MRGKITVKKRPKSQKNPCNFVETPERPQQTLPWEKALVIGIPKIRLDNGHSRAVVRYIEPNIRFSVG